MPMQPQGFLPTYLWVPPKEDPLLNTNPLGMLSDFDHPDADADEGPESGGAVVAVAAAASSTAAAVAAQAASRDACAAPAEAVEPVSCTAQVDGTFPDEQGMQVAAGHTEPCMDDLAAACVHSASLQLARAERTPICHAR